MVNGDGEDVLHTCIPYTNIWTHRSNRHRCFGFLHSHFLGPDESVVLAFQDLASDSPLWTLWFHMKYISHLNPTSDYSDSWVTSSVRARIFYTRTWTQGMDPDRRILVPCMIINHIICRFLQDSDS